MGDRDSDLTAGPLRTAAGEEASLLSSGLGMLRRAFRSLYQNLSLFALAVAMSLTLWAVVTVEQNPRIEGTFPSDIPTKAVNIPSGLDVFGDIDPVRVRISAPQNDWATLRNSSFSAEVDLSRLGPGRKEVRVDVRPSNPQVRVLEVMPERVTVWLEPFKKREVPVRVVVLGEATPGFAYGQPKPERDRVTVMGPASLVDEIESATAEVSIEGARVTINHVVKLSARSLQGRTVDGVRLDPGSIGVEVPIEQQIFYKTVPVHPVINGDVAPGYWIESISVDPAIVLVGGPRQVLEHISFLQTAPVDVRDAVNSLERMVGLALPEGAWLAGPQQVRMQVAIVAVEATKTFLVAPSVVGLSSEQQGAADPVEVTLDGPQPILAQLDPTNVRVTVDATGLVSGTYFLPPVVAAPERTKLLRVAPDRVRTVIR